MVGGTLQFGWFGPENAGALIALINAGAAAVTAYVVRPIVPAAFTGLIAAILALLLSYGIELPGETVAAINVAVYPLLAFLVRGNVSPITTALTSITAGPTPEAAAHESGPTG